MVNPFKWVWKRIDDNSAALSAVGAIAIPIMLFIYQQAQDQAEDAEKAQAAVKAYLSQLSNIFLEGKLEGNLDSKEAQRLRTAIRASTLALLKDPNLEGEHKGQIISYLNELKLIKKEISDSNVTFTTSKGIVLKCVAEEKEELPPIISLAGADLSDADLSGVDLSGADLGEVDLREANLTGTNFSGANFSRKNLSEEEIDDSSIGADFRKAILEETDFSEANLSRANFSKAKLRSVGFSCANLSAANFKDISLKGQGYTPPPLSDIRDHGWRVFILSALNRYPLDSVAHFGRATLRSANFQGANLTSASFKDADLTYADFRGADFLLTSLEGTTGCGAKIDKNEHFLEVRAPGEKIPVTEPCPYEEIIFEFNEPESSPTKPKN